MIRIIFLLLVLLVSSACGGGGGGSRAVEPPPQNMTPIANAGGDVSQNISPAVVALNGSASNDPENGALSFSWEIISQPTDAGIVLTGATTATPTFESMIPGDYEFQLTVTDTGGLTGSDSVVITLINDPPTLSYTTFNKNPTIGEEVTFDASASSDANGHTISFSWELIQLPNGSGMQLTYQGSSPVLRYDAHGDYLLELRVTDGYDESVATLGPIEVSVFKTTTLTNYFTDAEYDAVQNRIITVLSDQLFIIGPDGVEMPVALPTNATAVSVAPDGTTAAVAHDGWISHVDLNLRSVINTWAVAANLGDIVIDGQGYAYGFPETGQWVRALIVDLATGVTQESTGNSVRHGTRARLHPSGSAIYGANNGLSPSDIERYSIGGGTANLDYDSPYHGDFPFCGDLWFDSAGDSMLTRCRVIVRTTDDPASDMTYVMQLDNQTSTIKHAGANAFENAWFVIDGTTSTGSNYLKSYDLTTGNLNETFNLPFIDDSQSQRWIARYVFPSGDSKTVYVLAVDDDASFLRYALLERVDPAFSNQNFAPNAVAPRYLTNRVADLVTVDGSASSDPDGQPVTYQWTLVSQPVGSDLAPVLTDPTVSFTPVVAGVYELELVVDDGDRQSAITRSTVNVFDASANLVHRLEGAIDDVEFSKAMNSLVYLSSLDDDLHILDVSDFSERTIPLPQKAFRLGVAPDGLFASVSHAGMASLVDLTLGNVTDTQTYPDDWGDIVLDHNHRAHLVPIRDQWSYLVSLDFAGDQSDLLYGARAGTQVRMHPVSNWVYGADRGLSPSDFEKWDVSTFPSTSLGDSPYHGDYAISGDIWISETGDRLLVAGGNTFRSSSDPILDMTYSGRISDDIFPDWADHSSERNEWVIANSESAGHPTLNQVLVYYDDAFFNHLRYTTTDPIPTAIEAVTSTPHKVFFNDDGSAVIVVLEGIGITDPFAVQVSAP